MLFVHVNKGAVTGGNKIQIYSRSSTFVSEILAVVSDGRSERTGQ
jgi:hypothetical protein